MINSMLSSRRRIETRDIVIAVVLSVAAVAFMVLQTRNETRDVNPLAAPLALFVTSPVLWRRAAPIPAVAASFVALALYGAAFAGGGMVTCFFTVPLMMLYAYSEGAELPRRESRWGLLLALAFATALCLTDGPEGADASTLPLFLPLTAAIWGIGRLVRSRGDMAAELERQAGELRIARDARARLEVADDRARLSAELDELLRRRLSELAQLADAGARESDPRAALVEIERAGRQTLEEMRTVVGTLRGGDDDAPLEPQPTLTHLDALLLRAKGAGARLEIEGSPRVLPPGVELSAYRVVELLLDAVDDAPDVSVRVHFADDALELAVAGPAKRRREDAFRRAQERVRLHHGTLEATTRNGRAEALASLPIYAGA
jgi:signal transduction histidine kinase